MSTLEKTVLVLRQFDGDVRDISVTEIHRALGMPKSSAGRLLQHMREVGLLDFVGKGPRYRLGSLIFELARGEHERNSLASLAETALSEICKETGHTGYVSTLSGTDIVVLRAHRGTHALQVVTPLGMRMPAAETAIGRALLAQLSPSDVRKLYADWQQPRSPNSPASLDELLDVLRKVRERGYAVSLDEAVPNVGSTAVVVVERGRADMLGVCVSYSVSHVDAQERVELADVLRSAVNAIARTSGQVLPVPEGSKVKTESEGRE